MKTLILENEYSVNLAVSYFIDNPNLKEDWLCIMLYYDNIIALVPPNKDFNQKLICFLDFPIDELTKYNFTGLLPTHPNEIILNSIRLALERNYSFLPDLKQIERDELIKFANPYLPGAVNMLKDSFLTFDLLHHFIIKNIPSLGVPISKNLEKKLIDFKTSDLGKAFKEGISDSVNKFSGYYYITQELELLLKNEFISTQQEFLNKLDIDKLRSFKLSPMIEDGIGTVAGLIIPFLPLGTIKEIFNYSKNLIDFKRKKGLMFMLSIFYIQKILHIELQDYEPEEPCIICQTTEAEVENISDKDVDEFVFKHSSTMCYNHMIAYLSVRKAHGLIGKKLLFALKMQE